jgi:hypothetical protein
LTEVAVAPGARATRCEQVAVKLEGQVAD